MKKLIIGVAAALISGASMASDGHIWGGHYDGALPDFGPASMDAVPEPFVGGWGGDLDGAIADFGPVDPSAVPEPFAGGWGGKLDGTIADFGPSDPNAVPRHFTEC